MLDAIQMKETVSFFSLLFLRNSLLGRVLVLGDPHVSIRHLHWYLLNKDRSFVLNKKKIF